VLNAPFGFFACAVPLIGLALFAGASGKPEAEPSEVPPVRREFRGVWVATVDNIDWPSRPGLTTQQQQAELLSILDQCVRMRLNAVVFQVRPSCDAFYASKLEPWSEYLTGKMGQAPEPFYDPLAFAVEEAHKRGLELHTWFNPYRARHPSGKSEISGDHVSKTRPRLVKQYGRYLWLDPGEKAVQDHSLEVIRDVVRRYDIDGVHIDDYFYPYKERDSSGQIMDFPDEPSWRKYVAAGGKLARDDWRRNNVDRFIQRLYRTIKQEKKWVKFGISPFGIWRPGNPPQIKGFDQYSELYADARKWLVEGWVDYYTPQLYWKIDPPEQSYPVLLKWWVDQNGKGRHMWPGNFTSKVGEGTPRAFPAEEIVNQVHRTRSQPGATGNVHFSMKVFTQNRERIADLLTEGPYAEPAVPPASPWLDNDPPGRPKIELKRNKDHGGLDLAWKVEGEKPWLWVVRSRSEGKWAVEVLPGALTSRTIALGAVTAAPEVVVISAVDRCGNEGKAAAAALTGL
jgi:uncharacterized lipoprotein YddW (UPF0748 family)